MAAKPTKYPLEEALRKLVDELRLFVRKAGNYLFGPHKKSERMIIMLEIIAFTALGIAFIIRLTD